MKIAGPRQIPESKPSKPAECEGGPTPIRHHRGDAGRPTQLGGSHTNNTQLGYAKPKPTPDGFETGPKPGRPIFRPGTGVVPGAYHACRGPGSGGSDKGGSNNVMLGNDKPPGGGFFPEPGVGKPPSIFHHPPVNVGSIVTLLQRLLGEKPKPHPEAPVAGLAGGLTLPTEGGTTMPGKWHPIRPGEGHADNISKYEPLQPSTSIQPSASSPLRPPLSINTLARLLPQLFHPSAADGEGRRGTDRVRERHERPLTFVHIPRARE
ncbi:hypothetical protein JY651_39915 [Pyxidicoccus parkwayensis]|uniref:Uncharacterized protein n=1 Tax=Pyxidicoccus parkwayensis TaxID=2813578 RepID=A0ABX7NSG4_9BACT|nr:hypothetical protein [Pyxidicoccus parkwaysis]QSQ21294.1 hypothetical protein JY651_39915 [Pyxidicoccus parkwaysis]